MRRSASRCAAWKWTASLIAGANICCSTLTKGFRYLTEYNGHWNDCSVVTACRRCRQIWLGSDKYLGKTYKHFQTCFAKTTFVLGEFPWQVTVNDDARRSDRLRRSAVCAFVGNGGQRDHLDPRRIRTRRGYLEGVRAGGLAPTPVGVYENQPSALRAPPARPGSRSRAWPRRSS
jgi:hypothetical protein